MVKNEVNFRDFVLKIFVRSETKAPPLPKFFSETNEMGGGEGLTHTKAEFRFPTSSFALQITVSNFRKYFTFPKNVKFGKKYYIFFSVLFSLLFFYLSMFSSHYLSLSFFHSCC